MKQRGFTLLEILVVVVIIGIVVSIFTLSVGVAGGTDRELLREADRLDALLRLALEDATFQGRELGIRFYPDRYEFSVMDQGKLGTTEDDGWKRLPSGEVLGGRKLPPLFAFDLTIEGREVNLARSERDVKKVYQPQLFLFSSGDVSDAFEVTIRERDRTTGYVVSVSPEAVIEVKRSDE